MAAPTEIYVDPSIAADSGTGTIGDPYGDLQYALDTMTRDATNGDRINIQAGTDEVLSATLDLTSYGTPSSTAGLCLQGYTSAAGDGGMGGIDCNGGAYGILAVKNYVRFINLDVHNSTSTLITASGVGQGVIGCTAHNTSGTGIYGTGSGVYVIGCTAYDCNIGATASNVLFCKFYNGVIRDFATAVTSPTIVMGNTFKLSGSSVGISPAHYDLICNNSFYTTGTGIAVNAGSKHNCWVINNLFSGFDTRKSINFSNTTYDNFVFGNSIHDGGADPIYGGDDLGFFGDNEESLASSPFTDASSGDFTPLDVGSVLDGASPAALLAQVMFLNRGAVQSAAGGGGAARLIDGGLIQ